MNGLSLRAAMPNLGRPKPKSRKAAFGKDRTTEQQRRLEYLTSLPLQEVSGKEPTPKPKSTAAEAGKEGLPRGSGMAIMAAESKQSRSPKPGVRRSADQPALVHIASGNETLKPRELQPPIGDAVLLLAPCPRPGGAAPLDTALLFHASKFGGSKAPEGFKVGGMLDAGCTPRRPRSEKGGACTAGRGGPSMVSLAGGGGTTSGHRSA